MRIVTIGINLAKNVLTVHGVGTTGQPALAPMHAKGNLYDLILLNAVCAAA